MESGSSLATGVVLGEFTIQRLLGKGGMGAVYVAKQASTGRMRALKVLQPDLLADEKLRSRFLEEATISAGVKSEHVVEVVSAGVDERSKIPWIAMELLQGEPLDKRIERAPMSVADVAEVFRHLGDAIGAAHDVGIIHRDLKPENLFLSTLTSARLGWIVKVLDFGIARVLRENQSALTQTSNAGSPRYMAPEQASTDTPIRTSTDVWALGLIAFRLLANKEYWLAANTELVQAYALYAEILFGDLATASVRSAQIGGGSLPDGFDEWFARCVTRGERWKNGRDACLALVKLLESTEQQVLETKASLAVSDIATAATLPVIRSDGGGAAVVALVPIEEARGPIVAEVQPPPPPTPKPTPSSRSKWTLAAGFATALVVLVVALGLAAFLDRQRGGTAVVATDAGRVTELGSPPREAPLQPRQVQPDAAQVDVFSDVQTDGSTARGAASTRARIPFVAMPRDSRNAQPIGSSICRSAHPSLPMAWQISPNETQAERAVSEARAAGCRHSAITDNLISFLRDADALDARADRLGRRNQLLEDSLRSRAIELRIRFTRTSREVWAASVATRVEIWCCPRFR